MGAQSRDVLWLGMKEGAKFSIVGIAIGMTSALGATRLHSSELYGVSAPDPATFLRAASVMAIVTRLARSRRGARCAWIRWLHRDWNSLHPSRLHSRLNGKSANPIRSAFIEVPS